MLDASLLQKQYFVKKTDVAKGYYMTGSDWKWREIHFFKLVRNLKKKTKYNCMYLLLE